ncbi:MAG: nucleoside recognition domain-containing protein, partial [Tepidanaerobacteraceae bacterium]
MKTKIPHHKISKAYQLILPAIAVIITISIIQYPDEAFNAALNGLDVWFTIVLPALLPFFIGSQLLMGLGVVHFMGVLLEPFMRPLFNVPGAGSFVMAMGLASGYPVGAMLTGKLVKRKLCNIWEAERLMSFTNT